MSGFAISIDGNSNTSNLVLSSENSAINENVDPELITHYKHLLMI